MNSPLVSQEDPKASMAMVSKRNRTGTGPKLLIPIAMCRMRMAAICEDDAAAHTTHSPRREEEILRGSGGVLFLGVLEARDEVFGVDGLSQQLEVMSLIGGAAHELGGRSLSRQQNDSGGGQTLLNLDSHVDA